MTIESNKEWRKKSMTWGKRVILAALIIFGAVYMVLSMAARSKDAIRQGLEDFLEQATGENAEITDITSVTLVPDVMFRMRGVGLRDTKTRNKSLAKAEKVYISLPLLRLMMSSNWYNGFEIRGLEVASGFFLPKKLTLDFAGISDPTGGKDAPNFLMEGHYNDKPLLITAEMTRKERKKTPLYGLDDIFPVTLKLGDLEGHGFYVREWNNIDLKDIILTRGDKSAMFTIHGFEKSPIKGALKGTVNNIPFTGAFVQKEDKDVLELKLENNTPENHAVMAAFIKAISDDTGLAPDNKSFVIELKDTQELSTQ